MKAWRRVGLELLLVTLLVPQAFVFFYNFPNLFHGGSPLGLLKALSLYALSISWVSAPFLAVLTLLVRILIGARVRWYAMLPFCIAAGYLWLTLWNRFVYSDFSYLRAALPILLCSVGAAGWAMARSLYLESLVPQEKAKSPVTDLSE